MFKKLLLFVCGLMLISSVASADDLSNAINAYKNAVQNYKAKSNAYRTKLTDCSNRPMTSGQVEACGNRTADQCADQVQCNCARSEYNALVTAENSVKSAAEAVSREASETIALLNH